MSNNYDNRMRALADVVTIDAWHQAFDGTVRQADLHADVVFDTARVGGELGSPVRFRLSVKRAEVVVVIPFTEPLKVDPNRVCRDGSETTGTMTETYEKTARGKVAANIGGIAKETSVGISGGLAADGEISSSTARKLEMKKNVRLLAVTQSMTEERFYRWIIEGQGGRILAGRPWDSKNPRMTMIDTRRDPTKSIPPVVRIEIRCLREDLVIEDIEVSDQSLWKALKSRTGFNNRLAAAESYIRDRLVDLGLHVVNIEDKFGRLTVATATALPLEKAP